MITSRKLLCFVYLLFAFAGAILPTLANIEFMKSYGPGFDIGQFVELANVNPAAQSLSRDLAVGSSAIFVWIIAEARRLKVKYLWLVIISTFTIAFAFSAPLFLFLRERRLIELEKQGVAIDLFESNLAK